MDTDMALNIFGGSCNGVCLVKRVRIALTGLPDAENRVQTDEDNHFDSQ